MDVLSFIGGSYAYSLWQHLSFKTACIFPPSYKAFINSLYLRKWWRWGPNGIWRKVSWPPLCGTALLYSVGKKLSWVNLYRGVRVLLQVCTRTSPETSVVETRSNMRLLIVIFNNCLYSLVEIGVLGFWGFVSLSSNSQVIDSLIEVL